MPFSMAVCGVRYFNKIYDMIINVTLQVRIQSFKRKTKRRWICHGKKAFLSAFGNLYRDHRRTSASLTFEAALVLSLFIFAMVCMMLPMKVMNTERKVQAALESVGEDFSRYAYLKDMLEKGEAINIPGAGEFAQAFCGHLAAGAAEAYAQAIVIRHLDTDSANYVRMLRSSILEDGETFDLILDYEIRMPFPVLGLNAIERTARSRRRAWIGKPGKNGGFSAGDHNSETEMVYVGKNSTRYHRSRNCHYLANQLTSVLYEQVSGMRNESGGKYHACRVCGYAANAGSTVYIMPSGKNYHTSQNCTAIIAYVRAVQLSEVSHLGPCMYCSR